MADIFQQLGAAAAGGILFWITYSAVMSIFRRIFG